MDIERLGAEWPEAHPHQRLAWAQQVRFDVTLGDASVPALADLYRVVLESGGAAQRAMEEALLTALRRIGSPDAVPLLRDLLCSQHSAAQAPRGEVVEVVEEIASRTASEEALSLLEQCLDHADADVRDAAATAVVRAYREAGYPLPGRVLERLYEMLRGDEARHVRFAAGLALQRVGELDAVEALFWAEGMAGWEEDPALAIDDVTLDDWVPPTYFTDEY